MLYTIPKSPRNPEKKYTKYQVDPNTNPNCMIYQVFVLIDLQLSDLAIKLILAN